MAEKLLKLDVVTPDHQLISEEVKSVVVKSVSGELGFLANHAPLIAGLVPHDLRYTTSDNQVKHVAVGGGFVEVINNTVSVLAPVAETPDMIDFDRARRAAERAKERLARRHTDDGIDVARAQAALARAMVRLNLEKYI